MGLILRKLGPPVALFLFVLPAAAHHSRTIFDYERIVMVEGIVTKYEWANPHVHLFVETETDAGETVVWALESGPTTTMRRRGWSSDMFSPGDRVVVEGHPLKQGGRTTAAIESVRKMGETSSEIINVAAPLGGIEVAGVAANGIEGIWEVPRTSFVDQFSEPFAWPLTEKGAAALAAYDDQTMNPQTRCLARSIPWVMIFSGVQEIDVGDTVVSIRTEYDTVERTVFLNASSHDGAALSYHGHSIGWWEGSALIVDTSHFLENRNGNARGVQSGPQKHLTERFDLNADQTKLIYSFVLEDPEYMTTAFAGELQSAFRPDLNFAPVACDPEIARRFLEE